MKFIASFDIGTTNVKGILVNRDGGFSFEHNVPLALRQEPQRIEQDPDQWFQAVITIAAEWLRGGVHPQEIGLISFSGQMQDCIPVGSGMDALRPAILYSDSRAGEEAAGIIEELGEDSIRQTVENRMDGTLTFPKILWLHRHERELYNQTVSFLISSKDYVIAQLTGRFVTDPTSASTTGCMDIRTRSWTQDWFRRLGLDSGKMPAIVRPDEIAGTVHAAGAQLTGFAEGTPVLCGIGDAGAATLGAGVYRPEELYAYIGTTGWIASAAAQPADSGTGIFNLAYVEPGRYINIAPLMNAGNAHQWAAELFCGEASEGGSPYEEMERLIGAADRRSSGVIFLPYLNGERCPVQDEHASGCYVGIRPSTSRTDMAAAVLEGVALAMKQMLGLGAREAAPGQLTLIGGGAGSRVWCQIIADIFQTEVSVPSESQFLPCLGAALLGFREAGWGGDYQDLTGLLRTVRQCEVFSPDPDIAEHYQGKFEKFLKLYPALRPVF
ncbi:FGGY-family carbohydrate kinase [Paenibacillus sp. FJAT-26967]|uniref:xylulokinase n=1 Tax=Paenibacillus sp. FJAT-26967 TaxID=1729690 RepID=UPI0008385374|nr:FGGY family carbohydrate kinase [Paenibacillus sp. FJAT-26967]